MIRSSVILQSPKAQRQIKKKEKKRKKRKRKDKLIFLLNFRWIRKSKKYSVVKPPFQLKNLL